MNLTTSGIRIVDSRSVIFHFQGTAFPYSFFNGIPGNAHRFCDMSLTFASKETPANFIVILHCNNHIVFLRIKRLLFRVLFKWLTFKSAFGIKMATFRLAFIPTIKLVIHFISSSFLVFF